jgi:predicted DsbA family dithiol-disulfide isomerase
MTPKLRITNYLDVVSSWCLWAEPMWTELQRRYAGRVAFDWKIALLDESGLPKSRAQLEWYYHRSGTMMQSTFDLDSGWFEEGVTEYLAPNAIAEAARELGITDDSVRIALSTAGLREGRHTGQWEIAAEIGAATCGIDKAKLLKRAKSRAVEERLRATTAEFHALQITPPPSTRCSKTSPSTRRTAPDSGNRRKPEREISLASVALMHSTALDWRSSAGPFPQVRSCRGAECLWGAGGQQGSGLRLR